MSDFISVKTVKTRKEHRCWGCAEKFPIGTKMDVTTSVDCGKIGSVYWCEICSKLQMEEYEPGDLYGYGEFKESKARFLNQKEKL